jgi:hypothetical protein
MPGTKSLRYVKLKLTSQDPEIWIAPHRALSVFELVGADTLHDEIAGHPIFLLGRHIAEDSTLAIPFAVFRHT